MKKILMSLATISAVALVAVFASEAFFSDEETSYGNTFQAGSINLTIDSEQHYNGNTCTYMDGEEPLYQWVGEAAYPVQGTECDGTWPSKDLSGERFFNFTDVKPGDWGENTISFEVTSNDAWMCADLAFENGGELEDYLNVFWWADTGTNGEWNGKGVDEEEGDNVYQFGEKILYQGPRTISDWITVGGETGMLPLTFADSHLNWLTDSSPNTTPVPANVEQYVGVGWCFGTMELADSDGESGFKCDGSGDQDEAQGDSVIADLTFYVEQYRNNPDFVCAEHRQ